jgi:hypothetical protein
MLRVARAGGQRETRLYACRVTLEEEFERAAERAARFAGEGEQLSGVLVAEPASTRRVYLCSYDGADGRNWLALDGDGRPVLRRVDVRDAVSIAALCEIAVETAGGGDLEGLRSQLVALRLSEAPEGIEEAEEAALELERAVGAPPRVASPAWLDAVGVATLRLERALGQEAGSPFVEAMKGAVGAVESLAGEVERGYKRPLR